MPRCVIANKSSVKKVQHPEKSRETHASKLYVKQLCSEVHKSKKKTWANRESVLYSTAIYDPRIDPNCPNVSLRKQTTALQKKKIGSARNNICRLCRYQRRHASRPCDGLGLSAHYYQPPCCFRNKYCLLPIFHRYRASYIESAYIKYLSSDRFQVLQRC